MKCNNAWKLEFIFFIVSMVYDLSFGLPLSSLENKPCLNTLTMMVDGKVVPNGSTVKVDPGKPLTVVCGESSTEGTHMYFIVDDKIVNDMSHSRDDKSTHEVNGLPQSFTIQFSMNVTNNLHDKSVRCVADHSPSNCFEVTRVVINV